MLPPEQRINLKDWNFAITEKVQGDLAPSLLLKDLTSRLWLKQSQSDAHD